MKYKKGDVVEIRDDLVAGKCYYDCGQSLTMFEGIMSDELIGKSVVISRCDKSDNTYLVDTETQDFWILESWIKPKGA